MTTILTSLEWLPHTAWWEPYLEIPFQLGGRGPAGCDCWGLVHLAYQQERGVELHDFVDYQTVADGADVADALTGWQRIDAEPALGVLLFDLGKASDNRYHVGLATGEGRMLHTNQTNGVPVVIEISRHLRSKYLGCHVPRVID